jgi:hypothetical protein
VRMVRLTLTVCQLSTLNMTAANTPMSAHT